MKAKTSQKFSSAALQFIDSVVSLKPKVAVFDCDGTLWAGDAGEGFFYWEIQRGMVPAGIAEWAVARYADYKAGLVDEETVCGEMVTMNAGIPERQLDEASEEFFSSVIQPRIFPEMLELTHRLQQTGSQVWAVSSTNIWTIRAGVSGFGIQPDHILAVAVEIDNGVATDRLIRVPTDEDKARAIEEELPIPVDVCFGNTIHDAHMLALAKNPFAIDPTPELERIAVARKWRVYRPGKIK